MREIAYGKRMSESPGNATGQGSGSFDRDLLAENRARCQFESVPAPRYAHSRISIHSLEQLPVTTQGRRDAGPIGVEIEHRAYALHNGEERVRIAKLDTRDECVGALVK